MSKEEAHHLGRSIRPLRIRIGTRLAAARPCMACAVDGPMLGDRLTVLSQIDGLCIGTSVRRPAFSNAAAMRPALDRPGLRRDTHALGKHLAAIVGMYGTVAIPMEDDDRNRLPTG